MGISVILVLVLLCIVLLVFFYSPSGKYIITQFRNLFRDRSALLYTFILLLTLLAIFFPDIKLKINKLMKDQFQESNIYSENHNIKLIK